jgi:hypothetical protein
MPLAAVVFEAPSDRAAELAGRPGAVRFLRLGIRPFVMIDGSGPPAPTEFAARMPGLYTTAYSLRFALKRRGVVEKVGPLEGLWWTSDGTTDLDTIFGDIATGDQDRRTWRWTLMIGLPTGAHADEIKTAVENGRSKLDPPYRESLRAEAFEEGCCAQLLHLGPYATERASIERLHAAIAEAGLQPAGRHHEIYLGDPTRSAPERLRTILRQPVTGG